MVVKPGSEQSQLRPETVESLFVLWRVTQNATYREWGWQIFEAIERHAKVPTGGYMNVASVLDVPARPHPDDKMETWFLAETLKVGSAGRTAARPTRTLARACRACRACDRPRDRQCHGVRNCAVSLLALLGRPQPTFTRPLGLQHGGTPLPPDSKLHRDRGAGGGWSRDAVSHTLNAQTFTIDRNIAIATGYVVG